MYRVFADLEKLTNGPFTFIMVVFGSVSFVRFWSHSLFRTSKGRAGELADRPMLQSNV
jgi:hypothetical protein